MRALFLALALTAGCGSDAEKALPSVEPLSGTEFSTRIENFFEYDALRVGRASRFRIHLTDLAEGTPVVGADVTLKLLPGAETRAKPASVAGIYLAELASTSREPSITFPVLRGYEGIEGKIHIIHFDSHLDFSDGGGFVRFAHGNPLRRSIELSWISGLSSLGIRGLTTNTRTFEEGQRMGVQVIPALRMLRMGIKEAIASIPQAENYYITFDVDVIDPSLLTGTGTPVPGGLTYYQAKEALQEIAKKGGKIVGYEFVEVDPEYEMYETSSRMSARLMMDFLCAIFKHQGDKHPQPV